MKMQNKQYRQYILIVTTLVAAMVAGCNTHAPLAAEKVPPLPTGHVAFSPEFRADYKEWKQRTADASELQKKLMASKEFQAMKDNQRQLDGLAAEMGRAIPTGYTIDEASESFKPMAASPAQAQPQAQPQAVPQQAPPAVQATPQKQESPKK